MILRNNFDDSIYEVKIKDRMKRKNTLSYKLNSLSNGNKTVIDRRSNSDAYMCELSTYGIQSYIDGFILFIQQIRDSGYDCQLEEFNAGETIFGENVDYTSPIKVMIEADDVQHKTFKGVKLKFYVAVDDVSGLSFLGSGDFPVLQCLNSNYKANRKWNIKNNKSYRQNHFITDHIIDVGKSTLKFRLTKLELRELSEFHRVTRGSVFQLTDTLIKGIDRVFGIRGPALPVNVRIDKIKETFRDVNSYDVAITLVEHRL